MLVTEFIEMKLKEYRVLTEEEIHSYTWDILFALKSNYNILHNDRTLEMEDEQLDLIKETILKSMIKWKRS